MKRRMVSVSMVVATCAVLSIVGWGQQDPLVGTWKQNLAKSTYDPPSGAPTTGVTLTREAVGANAYKVTTDGMTAQGAPAHTEYTVTLDGRDYSLTGSADWDSVSATRIDASTMITVYEKQ